jgi:hypothetical protein
MVILRRYKRFSHTFFSIRDKNWPIGIMPLCGSWECSEASQEVFDMCVASERPLSNRQHPMAHKVESEGTI